MSRLRCKVGGEWKPLHAFSRKQQQLYQSLISRHGRLDAASPVITCREHAGAERPDITCELCGLTKPIGDFSKTNIKNEDNVSDTDVDYYLLSIKTRSRREWR